MGRKLTTEEIKERIYGLVEDEYELLSEYVNSKTKIKVKHIVCGTSYEVRWNDFQQGVRCPKCAGGINYTNEEIVQRIYELVGSEYTKMDENYINNQTKFKIKHNTCEHVYMVSWNNFKQGNRCPKCAGLMKLTNKEIVQKIYELVGDEYTKLDNSYINASTKFKIRHETCGCIYMVSWNSFQSGSRCPKCAGTMKLTTEDIKQRIYSVEGDNYKLLSEYVNAKTKIKIKHVACDYEYETLWGDFQQGHRCPKCSGLMKLTNEEIVQKIYELVGDEYTKLDDTYINSATKFKMRHNTCCFEYEIAWNTFQGGARCPKCSFSKGEKFIEDYLTNHNISFATQVRFDDCKYKNTLPFDFGILNSENEVAALLEYDGIQHFEPVKAWGGEETLKITQLRDQIKDDYCKKNGIPLLRIKYNEDIEEKLNLFINQEQRKVAN